MEELSLAFFATDYYANKDKYVPGMTLEVDLAALAYKIEEGEREIRIDGVTTEYYRESMEIEKSMMIMAICCLLYSIVTSLWHTSTMTMPGLTMRSLPHLLRR